MKIDDSSSINVGPGLSFGGLVEVSATSTLTVTGSQGPNPNFSLTQEITSDLPSDQLTFVASAGLPVALLGTIYCHLYAAGQTELELGGTLVAGYVVTVGGSGSTGLVQIGFNADAPLAGGGVILDQAGGTVTAIQANPNFTGEVFVSGGSYDLSANQLGKGQLVQQNQPSIVAGVSAGDPILADTVDVQSSTLNLQGQLTFPQAVTVAAGSTLELQTAGADVVLQGPLSGSGSILVLAGTLTISSSNNTFSGTVIQAGGTVQLTGTNALGSGSLVTLAATKTTLGLSASTAPAGQPVTFTAVVAPASGSGTPTGTVTFFINDVPQTPAAALSVVGHSDMASFNTSGLAPGTYTITASYNGDTTFGPSPTTPPQSLAITTPRPTPPPPPPPSQIPPVTVASVHWETLRLPSGKGKKAKTRSQTVLEIQFSGAVAGAGSVSAYKLAMVKTKKSKKKVVTTLKPIRLSSVVPESSPMTTSVELVSASKPNVTQTDQLEIVAADLTDAQGRPLAGQNGQPGTNAVIVFGRSGATPSAVVDRARAAARAII